MRLGVFQKRLSARRFGVKQSEPDYYSLAVAFLGNSAKTRFQREFGGEFLGNTGRNLFRDIAEEYRLMTATGDSEDSKRIWVRWIVWCGSDFEFCGSGVERNKKRLCPIVYIQTFYVEFVAAFHRHEAIRIFSLNFNPLPLVAPVIVVCEDRVNFSLCIAVWVPLLSCFWLLQLCVGFAPEQKTKQTHFNFLFQIVAQRSAGALPCRDARRVPLVGVGAPVDGGARSRSSSQRSRAGYSNALSALAGGALRCGRRGFGVSRRPLFSFADVEACHGV